MLHTSLSTKFLSAREHTPRASSDRFCFLSLSHISLYQNLHTPKNPATQPSLLLHPRMTQFSGTMPTDGEILN